MKFARTLSVLTLTLVLSACGSAAQMTQASAPNKDESRSINQNGPHAQGKHKNTTSLAEVQRGCDDGDPTRPGVVEISGELRDANVVVDIEDCIIRLINGADITLNNATITGGIINIHDRATEGEKNVFRLQNTSFDVEALLIELNDANDTVSLRASDLTAVRGLSVKAADDASNEGGSIDVVSSRMLVTNDQGPLVFVASEHSGSVRFVNSTADTQGLLLITAHECEGKLEGEKFDCSTEALANHVE